MYLCCDDINPVKCAFRAGGGTEDEILGRMMNHVKTAHPEIIETNLRNEPTGLKNIMEKNLKNRWRGSIKKSWD